MKDLQIAIILISIIGLWSCPFIGIADYCLSYIFGSYIIIHALGFMIGLFIGFITGIRILNYLIDYFSSDIAKIDDELNENSFS